MSEEPIIGVHLLLESPNANKPKGDPERSMYASEADVTATLAVLKEKFPELSVSEQAKNDPASVFDIFVMGKKSDVERIFKTSIKHNGFSPAEGGAWEPTSDIIIPPELDKINGACTPPGIILCDNVSREAPSSEAAPPAGEFEPSPNHAEKIVRSRIATVIERV